MTDIRRRAGRAARALECFAAAQSTPGASAVDALSPEQEDNGVGLMFWEHLEYGRLLVRDRTAGVTIPRFAPRSARRRQGHPGADEDGPVDDGPVDGNDLPPGHAAYRCHSAVSTASNPLGFDPTVTDSLKRQLHATGRCLECEALHAPFAVWDPEGADAAGRLWDALNAASISLDAIGNPSVSENDESPGRRATGNSKRRVSGNASWNTSDEGPFGSLPTEESSSSAASHKHTGVRYVSFDRLAAACAAVAAQLADLPDDNAAAQQWVSCWTPTTAEEEAMERQAMRDCLESSRRSALFTAQHHPEDAGSRNPSGVDDGAGPFGWLCCPLDPLRHVVRFLPRLDATFFLSCPDRVIPSGCSCPGGYAPVQALYATLLHRIALSKSHAELILRDDRGDGALDEEQLEAYIGELWDSGSIGPVTDRLQAPFKAFYVCAASRKLIFEAVTPREVCRQGRVPVDRLIATKAFDAFIATQLAGPVDDASNWFSASHSTAVYNKFLSLDSRKLGMLTASDLKLYKKGIPSSYNDGLPATVSPLSSFFIDRYMECTATFDHELDYKRFVDFVLTVESFSATVMQSPMSVQAKQNSLFFEIFDIYAQGVITPVVWYAFFKETYAKLLTVNAVTVPVDVLIEEFFEMLGSKEPMRVTREEFVNHTMASLVTGVIVDCLTFFSYDSREHAIAAKNAQMNQQASSGGSSSFVGSEVF